MKKSRHRLAAVGTVASIVLTLAGNRAFAADPPSVPDWGKAAAPAKSPDWTKAATPVQSGAFGSSSLGAMPGTSPSSAFATPANPAPGKGAFGQASPAVQSAGRSGTAASVPNARARSPSTKGGSSKLFEMDDNAIIIVSGRPTKAGELKSRIKADLAAKSGPPKVVKGVARKLDLAALGIAPATAAGLSSTRSLSQPSSSGLGSNGSLLHSAALAVDGNGARLAQQKATVADKTVDMTGVFCVGNGPPVIDAVRGKLKPGAKVTLSGGCLGDLPGRVEIIGQFPGGKLVPAFTTWTRWGVDIQVPADIRGATDHAVAISVVTSDGKTSAAKQAQFVAARERIEVPPGLWSPDANFETAATTETLNTATGLNQNNPAASGQIARSLRVQPQCALDTMDALVLSGDVTQITGFDQGPPNEARVTIAWVGTCSSTTTTTSYHYLVAAVGDDISVTSACRIAFQTRAWAYCPVGVAP